MFQMTNILSLVAAIFSTVVMSYISMATPIGPWIAPTLVLCGLLFFAVYYADKQYQSALVYMTISGSVGGILATAFGFSFPTLYFLDPVLFDSWMERPLYFAFFVSALAFIAAWYGLWIANASEAHFLNQEHLPFPIAQMIYKMIGAYDHISKAWGLVVGFVGTTFFCILQDGVRCFTTVIPKMIAICRSLSWWCIRVPAIELELWPMLWAIGFVTGHIIVLPLATGVLSKVLFVYPLQEFFFSGMSQVEFLLAFCSGMVVASALQTFSPGEVIAVFKAGMRVLMQKKQDIPFFNIDRRLLAEGAALLIVSSMFFFYIECSVLLQVYLLVSTFACAYQIIVIAGKIGLAQLGRFATFVLVPALFLFNLDVIQIAAISTFVEAASGVAVDILCGRKLVQLVGGSQSVGRRYQYFGMFVSCLAIGVVFWVLINRFKLGSPELFAQRSQARQLLVGAKQFDYWALLIGVVFGLVLRRIKMNPMLVLGGLLMPINVSLGLVIGGMGAIFVRDKEDWFPFWSGVFAANSVWMLIKALA